MRDDTSLEKRVKVLTQEINALKEMLSYERQSKEEADQELQAMQADLRATNKELCNLITAQKLEFDEAKELAMGIIESNKSVGESLAELLSSIYGTPVTSSELEPIKEAELTEPTSRKENFDRWSRGRIKVEDRYEEFKNNITSLELVLFNLRLLMYTIKLK
ncbi:MAG TPA: hypothetical protein V6D12_24330 [Candidatus Obscuribacterales bacterium]